MLLGSRDPVTMGAQAGPVDGEPQLRIAMLDGVAHWVPEQRQRAVTGWATRA
ncbi:MAG: hypothetical protein WBP81_35830 [Solirubrobacteraceae bacterium]